MRRQRTRCASAALLLASLRCMRRQAAGWADPLSAPGMTLVGSGPRLRHAAMRVNGVPKILVPWVAGLVRIFLQVAAFKSLFPESPLTGPVADEGAIRGARFGKRGIRMAPGIPVPCRRRASRAL